MQQNNKLQLQYRACVGVVVFNRKGQVFMGKRAQDQFALDSLSHPPPLYPWQFPQGGIDKGEAPMRAAYRELYEESGIKSVRLLYEMPYWLAYDLPDELIGRALKGKFRGQKQKWFAFLFEGKDSEIDLAQHEQIEFEDYQWTNMATACELIIPFKYHIYTRLAASFGFLEHG